MPTPVDAKRGRFMKRGEKEKRAAADEFRMKELAKPSGREPPEWFENRAALPMRPPTRSGRPYEAP